MTANDAGGRDSDGCVYTLEADGPLVRARFDVVTCPSCFYSVERRDMAVTLERAECESILAAIRGSGLELPERLAAGQSLPVDVRHRLAMTCYRALGVERFGRRESLAALEAALLLKAAWVARGEVVSAVGEARFRPRDLSSGLARFAELEAEYRSLRQPAVEDLERINRLIADVDRIRREVRPSEGSVAARLQASRQLRKVLELERGLRDLQRLTEERVRAAEKLALSESVRQLQLELVAAAQRLGLVERRRQLVEDVTAEAETRATRQALERIGRAVALEASMLREAGAALDALHAEGAPPAVELLRVDIARRVGDVEVARARFAALSPEARARLPREELARWGELLGGGS